MTKKVMAVDDSASIRHMVSFTLRQMGLEVIEAVDGRDALEKMQGEDIQMLIADVNMPNLNGIEMVKQVRENPEYRYIPIIMLTTESSVKYRMAAAKAGATGWIVKPFDSKQLLSVVNRLLQ